ncbi:DUF7657 domain-containing protein [Comamonas koreensis]|uniref:DUF7657 domain-containing protein n=1 Tax=Comamonas koreensis TaxID=160825 RepID=A0AAW4Y2X5_9BURK|nr:hypothetical protein [Comamonas koreensis]MCD2167805.1 hypothetical protein [Comamonas koreensis]
MQKISWRCALIGIWIITALVYIGNTWSPSSYAYPLRNNYAYVDIKPTLGQARPIRADEWGVVTPLTQATVRNQFERYNKTSLYQEDLRINYGLPIADWGLAFKPTMWLYGLVNPAYAYSFHWFAVFTLFITGYAFLFTRFGASKANAILLSFGLYFTGFSQFWWNEKGPILAIFPWVIMPFLLNLRLRWQLIWFYYAAVFWLLTNFYPPVQISLAFAGFVLLAAKQPRLFQPRTLMLVLVAAALAAGTVGIYLYDYLSATSATIYPGSRHSMGGGVGGRFVISWIFPSINFSWVYNSLIGLNISEIGTVGMYYYIAALFFLDYKNFSLLGLDRAKRRVLLVLVAGLTVQLLWMLLPIPSVFGKILLWDHVEPARMQYASGVLLTIIVLYVASVVGLTFSLGRLLLLCTFVCVGWWLFKYPLGTKRGEDLFILLPLVLLYLFARKRNDLAHEGLALASLIFGAVLFGRFNPLQSAWPIFNLPPNEVVKYLQDQEEKNNGVLVFPHLHAATANGLGFRALSHTNAVPPMAFWNRHFPDTPTNERNAIFNRYAHVVPDLMPRPRLQQTDAVQVPMDRFVNVAHANVVTHFPDNLSQEGGFEVSARYKDALVLHGWAGWTSAPEGHGLEVVTYPPTIGTVQFTPMVRADLPLNTQQRISALNGFKVMIPHAENAPLQCISLVSLDAQSGERRLLNNPAEVPTCPSTSLRGSIPSTPLGNPPQDFAR